MLGIGCMLRKQMKCCLRYKTFWKLKRWCTAILFTQGRVSGAYIVRLYWFRIMYIMLNNVSKTVAYTTQLLLQLSIMNLQNYIHDVEYVNEYNISYAEISSYLMRWMWWSNFINNNFSWSISSWLSVSSFLNWLIYLFKNSSIKNISRFL